MLTIYFEGVCAFSHRKHCWDVFLPVGHHSPHRPMLTIPARNVDLTKGKSTWLPDGLILNPLGDTPRYLAFWDLVERLVSTGDERKAAEWDPPEAIHSLVDLQTYNPGCPARVHGRAAVIRLHGGTLSKRNSDRRCLQPTKNNKPIDTPRYYAGAIQWTGDAKDVREQAFGREIALRYVEKDIVATISNLAADAQGGLDHFHNYYDLLEDAKPEDQVALKVAGGCADPPVTVKNPTEGVDCVPPGHTG